MVVYLVVRVFLCGFGSAAAETGGQARATGAADTLRYFLSLLYSATSRPALNSLID